MTIQAILKGLQQSNTITTADAKRLSKASDKKAFLGVLVKIFEDQARLYLKACKGLVKNELKGKVAKKKRAAIVLEKTIESALSIFLRNDNFCTFPSLMLLTKEKWPDIQASLGLKTLPKKKKNLIEIVERVFVGYVSRYSLIRMVDIKALQALCKEETVDSLVFPPYLLNALHIEVRLAQEIKSVLQSNRKMPLSIFLANVVASQKVFIHECLGGTLFFLGKLIDTKLESDTLRNKHFQYLSNPQNHVQFVQAVVEGYIEEMQKPINQQKEEALYLNICSSNVSSLCLPALKLIGISVELDKKFIKAQIKMLKKGKKMVSETEQEMAKTIENAKKEANEKIDKWRKEVPEKPIKWGLDVKCPIK